MCECDSYLQIKRNLPFMVKISRIIKLRMRVIRVSVVWDRGQYGDGAGNTTEKNSSIFSLV